MRFDPGSRRLLPVALAAALCLAAGTEPPSGPPPAAPMGGDWPSFRGPFARGVSGGPAPPLRWNVERAENLSWKTKIPGLGHSSPVVWGDRLYVTSAVGPREDASLKVGLYGDIAPVADEGVHRFVVYCLDRKTGRLLWEKTAHEGAPRIKRHTKSTHANPTPATDGKHLAVSFGSEGLYLYDMEGNLAWKKDLGPLDSGYYLVPAAQWGFGSSPVIHRDRVIVQCDVQGGGFLAAFRLSDGAEIWRTKREDVPTWSTPTLHEAGGVTQVIVNGWKQIASYDAATGKEIWRMKGGGDIPVPTPVVAHDLIFITNAHGGPSPVYAIRTDAAGEIGSEEGSPGRRHLAWAVQRGGAYMQTPLVYGERLFVCRDNGELTVFEARTGAQLSKQRLGAGSSGFTASGVAAGGRLYYTAESGEVYVLGDGATPEVLAVNELGEVAMATPAVSDGTLYFRTRSHVVAVAEPRPSGPVAP